MQKTMLRSYLGDLESLADEIFNVSDAEDCPSVHEPEPPLFPRDKGKRRAVDIDMGS